MAITVGKVEIKNIQYASQFGGSGQLRLGSARVAAS